MPLSFEKPPVIPKKYYELNHEEMARLQSLVDQMYEEAKIGPLGAEANNRVTNMLERTALNLGFSKTDAIRLTVIIPNFRKPLEDIDPLLPWPIASIENVLQMAIQQMRTNFLIDKEAVTGVAIGETDEPSLEKTQLAPREMMLLHDIAKLEATKAALQAENVRLRELLHANGISEEQLNPQSEQPTESGVRAKKPDASASQSSSAAA